MIVYWHEGLSVTCNEQDMYMLCTDEYGNTLLEPEDMGWERISVYVGRKSYLAYVNGEFDTALYESDKAGA